MLVSDSRSVTYSPAYTIVPTYECFNRCTYCNFRTDPGTSPWLSLFEAESKLRTLQNQSVSGLKQYYGISGVSGVERSPQPPLKRGAMRKSCVCEILILSGEVYPHSSRRGEWLRRIYDIGELALSLGFLPHTNAGPLSFEEMKALKRVNVSMGLMLEQLTPKLLQTVHRHAPSKVPAVRLQQLEWAGELRIPFTTGLLLGIGETQQDWWETLDAIAQIHSIYGHIQEVILQPHSPGSQQSCDASAFDPHQLPEVIAKARLILPPDITIQIPPNLVTEPNWLLACLDAGARDLGGIGPKDEVNPDYPHPHVRGLREILGTAGWELVPRLPVYPQYDSWLMPRLQEAVEGWRGCVI